MILYKSILQAQQVFFNNICSAHNSISRASPC